MLYNLTNVISEFKSYAVNETIESLIDNLNEIDGVIDVDLSTKDDVISISVHKDSDADSESIRLEVVRIAGEYLLSEPVVEIMCRIFPKYCVFMKEKKIYNTIFRVLPFGDTLLVEI